MPYYREYFVNDRTEQTNVQLPSGLTSVYPMVWDDVSITGWRSRPHRKAFYAKELLEMNVDPYAYFLEKSSETRYSERLAERGFAAQGSPDRGHAFELSRYNLHSSLRGKTVTRVSKSFGSAEQTSVFTSPVYAPDTGTLGLTGQMPPMRRMNNPPSNLETFAQQAYARTAPTARVFDAAQFLGELREGLPSIPLATFTSGTKIAKGAGSDFLNVEFGWKPLVNDIIKAGRALMGATDMLSGNGKRVHRRFGTPTQRTMIERTNENTLTGFTNWLGYTGHTDVDTEVWRQLGGPVGNGSAPQGGYYFLRTQERTQWFEGEFTNFFKLGFDPSSYIEKLDHLVNVQLTPSVLWELAPWSWLIDWHLRIGDTIKANELAANDRLVMHYGYAMEHTVMRDLCSVRFVGNLTAKPSSGSSYVYWTGLPDSATYVSTTEVKRRIRANPYGFRTGGTSALTEGQLSILGALGLTRLK